MSNARRFASDTSPAIILLDVAGHRHKLRCGAVASEAIALADKMQALSGNELTERPRRLENAEAAEVLLYYVSRVGRPKKGELARAAKIIAASDVRYANLPAHRERPTVISGRRAVVYPEAVPAGQTAVPFMVSKSVWFNHNRFVPSFPDGRDECKIMLEDINRRLTEGSVSFAR